MKYGYARVSTTDQDLGIQETALQAAGCAIIRGERVSGTGTAARRELRTLLDFLRQGDTLAVTRVDRLARSMGDLQDIVREIRGKGCSLLVTEQNVDTSTPAGRAFFDMLGVFAEFETSLRAERQMEGIAKAKAEGKFKGSPQSINPRDRRSVAVYAAQHGGAAAAQAFDIARSSVYRIIDEFKDDAIVEAARNDRPARADRAA